MTVPLRALAIGAHPDDVEIFCLGLLLRLRDAGWDIGWAVATDGLAGLDPALPPETRRLEALAAGRAIGVEPWLLGFEDGSLTHEAGSVAAVRTLLGEFKPSLVVTHAPNDYHADHRALSLIVDAALAPNILLLHCDTMVGVGFLPDFLVDVTPVFEEKLTALRCHASQRPELFLEPLATWSRFRAIQGGGRPVLHAEAYREVKAAGRPTPARLLRDILI